MEELSEYGLFRLADMPTSIGMVHESCYRATQTLNVVRRLLQDGTPGQVVLALLAEVDKLPGLQVKLADMVTRQPEEA